MAQKILAIKLRSLGDTVLMTAPLLEMRRAFPSASIHALVRSEWAPLLEKHSAVNQVWAYDRRREPAARARTLARWALRLRKERYDTVVNFHASPSSSLRMPRWTTPVGAKSACPSRGASSTRMARRGSRLRIPILTA